MLQHDSDKYWYAWHLRQKKMYTQGNIELDREMIFDYCTEAFRAKETRIETVIEIGVGNAYLLNRLNQLQPRIEYIGIDRNRPILIKNSREFPELKFIHGDAVKVIEGIKTGRFVFIYSIATLEYLPEAEISQLFSLLSCGFLVFAFDKFQPEHSSQTSDFTDKAVFLLPLFKSKLQLLTQNDRFCQ